MTPPLPLAELYARAPRGVELGLERMRAAAKRLGHPERRYAAVHVAGTNGKGSVCAMVEAMARAAGLRTGLYTSPHLCRFAERIRVAGAPLDDVALASALEEALAVDEDVSFFEAATLAAFVAFRDAAVDLAVIEVGLGGRLDATNILEAPLATAITSIGLDHTDRLGTTVEAIALEKAHIAKAGVPLVLGAVPEGARAVIEAHARAVAAPLIPALATAELDASLSEGQRASYQRGNAAVADALGELLALDRAVRRRALADAVWPGRLERVAVRSGVYLLDGAHNGDGARALAASFERDDGATFGALVFGAMADKAWRDVLDVVAPLAAVRVYVAPALARAAPPSLLSDHARGEIAATVGDALRRARALAGDRPVLVTGSLYLVGAARAELLALPVDPPVAL